MNDSTPAPPPTAPIPDAPIPTSPAAPGGPPPAVTAPPDNATRIAHMLHTNTIDAAQAGKLAKAGNISTLAVAVALSVLREAGEAQPDARSPEAIKLDEQFGPVAQPGEFVIQWNRPGDNTSMSPEETKARDTAARGWLTEAQFSRELGNSLVSTIARVAQTTKEMTESELESYAVAEYEKLQQIFGTTLDDRLRSVDRMVQVIEAKQPGLVRLLKSRGVFDTAMVASLLIQQAERYWARRR